MMAKINLKTCSEKELWLYVSTHLKKRGIGTVLLGGAVVSVYTNGAYQSGDLDFVREGFLAKDIDSAMAEIGFYKNTGRHYLHPDCSHLYIEFCGGPLLGIGDDSRYGYAAGRQCHKDNVLLAGFFYFSGREYAFVVCV